MDERIDNSVQWAALRQVNRESLPDQGLIYFVLAGPYLKVGISTKRKLRDRIKYMQVGNANWVRLLKAVYADEPRQAEREFHDALEMYHVRGEWFKLDYNHPIMKMLMAK